MAPLFYSLAAGIGSFQGLGAYQPSQSGGSGSGGSQLANIFSNILGFLTVVGGIMFLIFFVIGALNWITAGGDTTKVENAQKRLTGAAIGLIIIVLAYAIAWIVGKVLGIDILDPASELNQITP